MKSSSTVHPTHLLVKIKQDILDLLKMSKFNEIYLYNQILIIVTFSKFGRIIYVQFDVFPGCWWLLSILGSSPNGAGTGGVVGIAFLWGHH